VVSVIPGERAPGPLAELSEGYGLKMAVLLAVMMMMMMMMMM
jgi:hypothetical protein